MLLVVLPADRAPAGPGLGRLGSLLTLAPATAASRVETIVDVEVRIGDQIVRPPDNEADSMAAIEDIRVLADAFDALSVQSAAFSTDVFRFADNRGVLVPYQAVATGATLAFLVIALAMNDPAGARENASRLRAIVESGASATARRPWSELVGIDSIEVRGRVMVAVLSTKVPTLWLSLERQPDTFLWWHP
ncbi:MAG: hypothetical protein QOC92_1876 [Acidimicrobiaceae bacterium]